MSKSIKDKRVVYNQVFENPAGHEVLSDLRRFCFATKSPFDANPYEMARRVGRQEAFMQICNIMKVKYEDFYDFDDEAY